jgi:hypothetical protein
MLRYITVLILAVAGSVATHANMSATLSEDLQCNKTCRNTCLDKNLGESCVLACGCESLQDTVAEQYVVQMLCSSECKSKLPPSNNPGLAAINAIQCSNKCN